MRATVSTWRDQGCPQGPALCLPCWLEAVEGKGPWQAQRCQWEDTAQAGPPCQGAEGPCLAAAGESLPVPSVPLISQPQADPPAPLCLLAGAVLRGALLSPGSSELEAFLFLVDMMCVNSEHCECPCTLRASPGRTDARAEPGSLCSAPSFMRHNGRTLTRTVTSWSPPQWGCGWGPSSKRVAALAGSTE